MSAKSSQYGDKAQGTDLLEKEIVAEFTRTQLSNEGVVERIVKENRNVATRIYNALKKAYTNIKNKLPGKETNLTDMEKAINLFEKALGENRKMSFTEALVKGNTDTRPYIDDEDMVQFSDNGSGEKRYLLAGEFPDGRKVYKTNYPIGTPKSVKQQDIIDIVQNVWSKKPITLNIGNEQIEAQFNTELAERSDLSKIAFGIKHGTASERRITLDLATDFYMIAEDAHYTGSKSEKGKTHNPAHNDVKNWRYFATNLIYEGDDVKTEPCFMNIKKSWIEKDREKLAQLKKDAEIFIDANPKLDYGKIDKAIGVLRLGYLRFLLVEF